MPVLLKLAPMDFSGTTIMACFSPWLCSLSSAINISAHGLAGRRWRLDQQVLLIPPLVRYLSVLFSLMSKGFFQLLDFLQIRSICGFSLGNTPLLIEELITLMSNFFHILTAD